VPLDITRWRLRNQRLSGGRFTTPEDVVSWLGAVQAQEYADSKWALSLRMRRATDTAIERALSNGTILRTHVLRPTWHFVAAADIRWMLSLTAPRVSARMAPYNRHLELDAATFRRSERAIVRALQGGVHLTRQELKAVLHGAGVRADGAQKLAHLVMQAEIDAVICSGARRANQPTYALLDERVPPSPERSRDDALAELTRRYFTSHGPAQIADFAWWSGLTTGDVRRGIQMIDGELHQEVADGKTYWFRTAAASRGDDKTAYLLGLYDEYLIAYKDRSAALDQSRWVRMIRDPFSAPIVVNGKVVGGWRRSVKAGRMVIAVTPFAPLRRSEAAAIDAAAHAYAGFFGSELELSITVPS
jgi:hypothetical protein